MKWGTQLFLNDATSDSDGWFKGYIQVKRQKSRSKGSDDVWIDSAFILSDCSHKASIEFDVWNGDVKKQLVGIRKRRRKIARLRKAVNTFCDKYEDALDIVETELKNRPKEKK